MLPMDAHAEEEERIVRIASYNKHTYIFTLFVPRRRYELRLHSAFRRREEGLQMRVRDAHDLICAAIIEVEHIVADDCSARIDDAGFALVIVDFLRREQGSGSAERPWSGH